MKTLILFRKLLSYYLLHITLSQILNENKQFLTTKLVVETVKPIIEKTIEIDTSEKVIRVRYSGLKLSLQRNKNPSLMVVSFEQWLWYC